MKGIPNIEVVLWWALTWVQVIQSGSPTGPSRALLAFPLTGPLTLNHQLPRSLSHRVSVAVPTISYSLC